MIPWWRSPDRALTLYQGDALEIMRALPACSVDLVFADPPYFLSNGGTTCQGGERVRVDKGAWDQAQGPEAMHHFNLDWLGQCRRLLKPDGTLWVSGTHHVIHSVGFGMQQLGFRVLNEIAWEKPNPPPNLGCRCFTHSTETLLWAARSSESAYHFDYQAMKAVTGKQMKSVWKIGAPRKDERTHGRHPTQKPEALLRRIVEASCLPGRTVLDPFNGSGTTGAVAREMGRRYIGIDQSRDYLDLTRRRLIFDIDKDRSTNSRN